MPNTSKKTRMKLLKINAVYCLKCKDTIFSRARHDFRWCSCKSVGVDGGLDYFKITGSLKKIKLISIKLPVTEYMLYDDWNRKRDVWGLIPNTMLKNYVEKKKCWLMSVKNFYGKHKNKN